MSKNGSIMSRQRIIGTRPKDANNTKAVSRNADGIDQMLEEGVITGFEPDFSNILGKE